MNSLQAIEQIKTQISQFYSGCKNQRARKARFPYQYLSQLSFFPMKTATSFGMRFTIYIHWLPAVGKEITEIVVLGNVFAYKHGWNWVDVYSETDIKACRCFHRKVGMLQGILIGKWGVSCPVDYAPAVIDYKSFNRPFPHSTGSYVSISLA